MMESPPLKPRRLKVSYMRSESRSTEPAGLRPRLSPKPYVRLLGRWLDAAGFAIGSDVRVEVSAGRLVLEVIDPANTQAW